MKKSLYVLGVVAFALAAGLALAAPHHGPDEVVIDDAAAKREPVPVTSIPRATFPGCGR